MTTAIQCNNIRPHSASNLTVFCTKANIVLVIFLAQPVVINVSAGIIAIGDINEATMVRGFVGN